MTALLVAALLWPVLALGLGWSVGRALRSADEGRGSWSPRRRPAPSRVVVSAPRPGWSAPDAHHGVVGAAGVQVAS